MKPTKPSSRIYERYGMIEALEARIAPASLGTLQIPSNATYITATVGSTVGSLAGSILLHAGDVLTTGSSGGGSYLLYVAQGEIRVFTTDLNSSGQIEFNDITGVAVGNGAAFVSFVDIHGSVVTNLNPDGSLSDGGKGDILLDSNIAEIELRSVTAADFTGNATTSAAQMANNALALSSYSIFGNIYAGGGLGLSNNTASGLHIDTSGGAAQATKFSGVDTIDYYQPSTAVIGSIYAGSSASGQSFTFGSSGQVTDIFGNLLTFNPAAGEAGASIYNISSAAVGQTFNIGTIHAGDGGFNAPGGSIVNVALQGDNAGTYQLIAGNAGSGTTGQAGGSIINFSETGAFISEVVLQSGNGGNALTGPGGSAGQIQFNPAQSTVNINAHFILNYGSGGTGYTSGAAGGGTTSGTFITPNGTVTTPLNLVTTMHTIGSIGSTVPIDFNGDGISDAVFSTTNPNQVVVALGEYTPATATNAAGEYGLQYAQYIYLNSPANVESIVVGDFTGNGHPDIAVASGSGSNAGIEVYLSQYSKTGVFEGFSDPLFSPLPSLDQSVGFYSTTAEITKLVAGGFQANGVLDLAAVVQEINPGSYVPDYVLIFLNGETNSTHPLGSGYFYANFKDGLFPVVDLGTNFNPIQSTVLSSALQTFTPGTGYDVVFLSNFNDTGFDVFADPFGTAGLVNAVGWGTVLPPGAKNPVQFHDYSFTITQDQLTPTVADVVAVSQNPQAFIVSFAGDGVGDFNLTSGAGLGIDFAYGGQVEPVGIVTIPSLISKNNPVSYESDVAILDYNGTGADIIHSLHVTETLVAAGTPPDIAFNAGEYVEQVTIAPGLGRSNIVAWGAYTPVPAVNANYPGSGPTAVGFITMNPLETYPDFQGLEVTQPLSAPGGAVDYMSKNSGYFVSGGEGGNSLAGAAGAGGGFGQSLSVSTEQTVDGVTTVGTGTLSFEFPTDLSFEGTVNIVAGNGGNGFGNGGAGGSNIGISVSYPTPTQTSQAFLFAGNGGESLTATGGAGGSMGQLFIQSGEAFVAGNGGIGVIGGSGGSLLGNPQQGLITAETNSVDPYIVLQAGNGATGITGGGSGGNITSFVNQFDPYEANGVGIVGSFLNYTAGNAGNAVAGLGGTGGNITNSGPSTVQNALYGDIFLQAGAGGSGLAGGAGGSISNFANVSTTKSVPTSTTFLGGAGGNSTIGTGGAGGSISDISASSSGIGYLRSFNFSDPEIFVNPLDAISLYTPISYNRMVAGPGGSSVGGVGGAGGSIGGVAGYQGTLDNVITASIASSAANVVVAGAGGAGLTAGGAGGSVANTNVDAAFKVVIIAGDGGSSASVKPADLTNPTDVALAIGGVNGPGGKGGNIINFTQPGNTQTYVDLIAGNGGATLNHSFAAGNSAVDNPGVGGSILNTPNVSTGYDVITGNLGDSDPTVAIKSYNDILAGQTMQQFVNSYILGDPSGGMDNTVGNVGLVAGAAGLVEGVNPSTGSPAPGTLQPSNTGINGSVSGIYAENIMSMVAGNVDQVALIQNLTNYLVTTPGGIYGAPKSVSALGFTPSPTPGALNYISPDGLLVDTPLPGGGALLDGAIVAKNIRFPLRSDRDFQGTES